MKVALAYVAVIAVWSTTPLGIKLSIETGESFTPLVARTVIGLLMTLLCLAFMSQRVQWNKQAVQVYVASAASIVGAMGLTYLGAAWINSGMIAVIYGLSPIVTGLFSIPILREPMLRPTQLTGALIAVAGLSVVFYAELRFGGDSWKGLLYVLAAVVIYSLSAVLVKFVNNGVNPLVANAGSLIVALPFLALLAQGGDYAVLVTDETLRYVTLYLGIIGSFVGFVLYYYVLQSMSPTQVMMIPLVTPLLALLIGSTVNNEQVPATMLLGSLMVVSGLFLYLMSGRVSMFARRFGRVLRYWF